MYNINNIMFRQVGWLKAGDQTILALHKRVITHNSRVQVSHEDNRVRYSHFGGKELVGKKDDI
jgi:hypothetical protein